MDSITGMTATGRRIPGTDADLVEVVAGNGLKHLALVYGDAYREHDALGPGLGAAIGFMEAPGVTGLLSLAAHELGAFTYASGTAYPVSEVIAHLARSGEKGGVRAGLELAYLTAEILVEASEKGLDVGLTGHGSLSPQRVVIRPDGQVRVLGYGLPQIDLWTWRDAPNHRVNPDAFRYAPPERLRGDAEELSSDLFALSLVAIELMVGQPVYDGLIDDIEQQATRGEANRRLYRLRSSIPTTVNEVFARALKPDHDTRYRDGLDFVYALHDLLGSVDVEGPGLLQLMTRFIAERSEAQIAGGDTNQDALDAIARHIDGVGDTELPKPRKERPPTEEELEARRREEEEAEANRPRWGRVARSGDEPEPEPEPASKRDRMSRLRSRRSAAPEPEPSSGSDARERLLSRLRDRDKTGPIRRDDAPRRRGRLRRSDEAQESEEAPTTEPQREPPAAPPVQEAPAPSAEQAPEPVVEQAPEPVVEQAPAPEPPPDPAAAARDAAAALLARLKRPPAVQRAPAPTQQVVAPAPPPVPDVVVKTAAPAPVVAPDPPKPAAPPTPPAPNLDQLAEVQRQASDRVERVVVVDGERHALRFPPAETLAAAAARAALEVGALRFDLSGRLKSWVRLAQDGVALEPSLTVRDAPEVMELLPVSGGPARVEVVIEDHRGVRFDTVLDTAVPVGSLVDHLVDWLGLEAGGWQLFVDGKAQERYAILQDRLVGDGARVVLKR